MAGFGASPFSIINFGLGRDDLNYRLMTFIDPERFSHLPLKSFQIDALADILDWDVISNKQLEGWLFVKHQDKINWPVFLRNGKPKDIVFLQKVEHKLLEHKLVFDNHRIKKAYYTDAFLYMFPKLVDWNWCVRNIKIDSLILEKNWCRMKPHLISEYQSIPDELMFEKRNELRWNKISKLPMSENTIRKFKHYVYWNLISKYQKLSEPFIEEFMSSCSSYHISRYQKLSYQFIEKYWKWLDMEAISKYQNIPYTMLRKNWDLFSPDLLSKNNHFNKPGEIQIINHHDRWYIIKQPMIALNSNSDGIFCDIDYLGWDS